jgi:hypothetical protein
LKHLIITAKGEEYIELTQAEIDKRQTDEELARKEAEKNKIKKQLDELDKKLTRGAEDLIDILVDLKVIKKSDIKGYLKDQKDLKQDLRQQLKILEEES